jgi:hypothetical protein
MIPHDNSTLPIAPPWHRLRTRRQSNGLPSFHRHANTARSSSHNSNNNGKFVSIAAICLTVTALSMLSFPSLDGGRGEVGDERSSRRSLQVELEQPAASSTTYYNSRMEALAGECSSV